MKEVPHYRRSGWATTDVVRLVVGNAVGLALITFSWLAASAQVVVRDQIRWMNVALLGVAIAGLANGRWYTRGRLSVGARRRRFVVCLGEGFENPAASDAGEPVFVALPGMRRFHRPGCPLVTGKATRSASVEAHSAAGRRPCGVCAVDDDRP